MIVEDDGLLIRPTDLLNGATLDTHHDHRLAMAFGLLGLVVDGIAVSRPCRRLEELARILGRARLDPGPSHVTRIAAFDLDGTLTDRDCVVPFLRRVAGTPRLVAGVAAHPIDVSKALVGRDRDAFKALATRAAFAGRPLGVLEPARRRVRGARPRRLVAHRHAGHPAGPPGRR